MANDIDDTWTEAQSSDAYPPAAAPRRLLGGLGRRGAVIATLTGFTGGGLIGGLAVSHAAGTGALAAAQTAPQVAAAGSGTAATGPVAQAAATTATPAPGGGANRAPAGGPPHGGGVQDEDMRLVAGVIGISASQLQSDLSGGKTIAQVAQAHSVGVDRVISAWTNSENAEIDARVKSGQLTQAQAGQQKATTRQRVTAQVNRTGHGPAGGPGGPHGGGGPGRGGPGGPPTGAGTGA